MEKLHNGQERAINVGLNADDMAEYSCGLFLKIEFKNR